jgi:hypothetical protein
MTKDDFVEQLKKLNLSEDDFVAKIRINHSTLYEWYEEDKMPYWTKSWLAMYKMTQKIAEVNKTKTCSISPTPAKKKPIKDSFPKEKF